MRPTERGNGGGIVKRALQCIAIWTTVALATPTVTFPLNSQVPPVARVGQPFRFTFSPSTFTSNEALSYKIKSGPSWLSLDNGARTLFGTPKDGSNAVAVLDIEASDSTGSVTMSSTLIVSTDPAPGVAVPLSKQLENFGDYSAPNSLLFYPSTDFSFRFDSGTFESSAKSGLNKYAVTLGNAPLPSWINFDPQTMAFSGKTPDSGSLVQPPELFGIQLIASEILGFRGTSIPFYLVVQNHKLVWDDSFLELNATGGQAIDFKELRGKLLLDGKQPDDSDLVSVTSDGPEWLKFHSKTFALSGTPPKDASPRNVTITAKDKYDDVASAIITIQLSNNIFLDQDIPALNATIGEKFSYNVSTAFANPSAVDVSVSIVPETSWLSYDAKTFVLSGDVPDAATESRIKITLSATTKSPLAKRATDSNTITINVVQPSYAGATSTSAQSSSGPAQTSASSESATSTTAAAAASETQHQEGLSTAQIVIAAVVPNVVLICAALLIWFCWKRRNNLRVIEKAHFVPAKEDISKPQLTDQAPPLSSDSGSFERPYGLETHQYHGDSYDTVVRTRRQYGQDRRSSTFSVADSDYLHQHQLRRSCSDNYIAYGSYPTDQVDSAGGDSQARPMSHYFSDKTHVIETPQKPPRASWKYKPFRTFSDESREDSTGSIQITPEGNYIHNYGQNRISKPPPAYGGQKTRNYLGSISGMPSLHKRFSGIGHRRNPSVSSNGTFDEPRRHRFSAHGKNMQSVDSDTSWLTIPSSPRKSIKGGRANSMMSGITENTDVLYSDLDYDQPELPRSESSVHPTLMSPQHITDIFGNTIRMVASSSDEGPLPPLVSAKQRGNKSPLNLQRPVTRRGPGSSPFFSGSSRTNSRATSRKSPKVLGAYLSSDSPAIPERSFTNESLERSILSDLGADENTLASRRSSRKSKRDVFGINYGGQTPDLIQRRSCVYRAGYRSPEESTFHLKSFVERVANRPSWQNSPALSTTSARFKDADASRHSPAPTFRDSHGNSIHYDDENESPQLNSASIGVPGSTRPSVLTPYSSRFGQSVSVVSPLSPLSPRPVDLGSGRVRDGPARRGAVRMSHERNGSLSVGTFLEGKENVSDEEAEWLRRIEEQRQQERDVTPGAAFL